MTIVKQRRITEMKDLVIIRWDAWSRYEKYWSKCNKRWQVAEQANDWDTVDKLLRLAEVALNLMTACNDFEC
jgi:hypothetical protein